jgi:hypothetical protein
VASISEGELYAKPQNRTGGGIVRRGLAVLRVQSAFLVLTVALLAELALLLWFRQVNLDEGWYLWASKLVYEGKVLYRDFAYTQTPLLPYIYGFSQQVLGEGLYQGRLFTLALSLATVLLTVATAVQVAGRLAGLIGLAFCVVSFFALAQFSYTATYALTALFMAAALWVAVSDWPERWRIFGAVGLAALAVAVRLSVIVILPPLVLYLAWRSRRQGWAILGGVGAALFWLALTVGLYWSLTGELMVYDIVGFHTDRLLRPEWHQLRMWHMGLRTLQDFLALVGVLVAAGCVGIVSCWRLWRRRGAPASAGSGPLLLTLSVIAAALFVVHLLPRTTDSYYNALQMPLLSLAGGVLCAGWLAQEQPERRRYLWVLVVLVLVVHGGRQWRGFVRDGYVAWPPHSQLARVQEAAGLLRRFVEPGSTLLSFSPHLALESGLRVAPGYEMAIFAYRPTWSNEEVERYKVVNNERLLADLHAGVSAVALTTFDLEQIYGVRDAVQETLTGRYRWIAALPLLGPYNDDLNLYLPPQFGALRPQYEQQATLADHITLLGYDLAQTTQTGTPELTVALYWQAGQRPSQSFTVFVQLLDAEGRRATGWDNPPCRGTCPTETWQAGEWVRDEYRLALGELSPGVYTLHVGLYESNSGVRLPVLAPTGVVAGDHLILTEIRHE